MLSHYTACPSRCTEYCHPHNHCKRTIIPRPAPSPLPPLSKVRCCRPKKFGRLPEGLPHHYPSPLTNPPEPALSFEKHYILASLVKGEVLSPEKIRATTGGIASPLSLACTNPPEPALSFALHQHPCL